MKAFTLLFLILFGITITAQTNIYLHTDRAIYSPDETIYFSGVVCNNDYSPVTDQKLLYIELYGPGNLFEDLYMAEIVDGRVKGQIKLPENMQEGTAYLKAFSGKEENPNLNYFKLPIVIAAGSSELVTVDGFSPSLAVPRFDEGDDNTERSNDVEDIRPIVKFYPEGGELVAESFQKLGVSAMTQQYQPLAVKGEIVADDNSETATFETGENGLGVLAFQFKKGMKYTAKINLNGAVYNINLPTVKTSGHALSVQDEGENYQIRLTTDGMPSTLAVYGNGQPLFSKEVNNGETIKLSKALMPEGISRVRLLNSNSLPVCERLVYKPYKSPDVDIYFDKPEYTAGEILIFDVKGSEGIYSVSFLDKNYPLFSQIIHPSIDKSLHFFNALKEINPNMKGYNGNEVVESPELIEKMLLTYGWRSFRDEEAEDNFGDRLYFKGRVLNALTRLPQKNNRTLINIKRGFMTKPLEVYTDDNGYFEVEVEKYSGDVEFKIFSLSEKGRFKNAIFELETNRHKWVLDNTQQMNQVVMTQAKTTNHPYPTYLNISSRISDSLVYQNINIKPGIGSERIKNRRIENNEVFINDTITLLTEFLKTREAPLTQREKTIDRFGVPVKSLNNKQLQALHKDVKYNSIMDYAIWQWRELIWEDPALDDPWNPGSDYFKGPFRLSMNGDQTQPVYVFLNGKRYYYGENLPPESAQGNTQGVTINWDILERDRNIIDAIDLGSVKSVDLIKVTKSSSDIYNDHDQLYLTGELGYKAFSVNPYIINIVADNSMSSGSLKFSGTIMPKTFYRFHQKETPRESQKRFTTKTVQWYPKNQVNKKYGFELNKINGDMLAVVQGMSADNKPFSVYKTVSVAQNLSFLENGLKSDSGKVPNSNIKKEIEFDEETLDGKWINPDEFISGVVNGYASRNPLQNVLLETDKGIKTLSNNDGEFAFPNDYLSGNTGLTASNPGFITKNIMPDKEMNRIVSINLVQDTARISLAAIKDKDIRSAYRNTLNKRKNELSEIFYREKVKKDNDLFALNEYQFVYKIQRTSGDERYFSAIKKARTMEASAYSEDVKSRPRTSKFGNLFTLDFIMNPPPFLDQMDMHKFEYNILSEVSYNDRVCLVVQFDQKDEMREALQQGTIWIDKTDMVILYIEFGLSPKGKAFFDPLIYMTQAIASDFEPGDIRYTNSFDYDGKNIYLNYATEYFSVESPGKSYEFEKEMVAVKSYNTTLALQNKPLGELNKNTLLVRKPSYNADYWLNIPFILPEEDVRNQVEFLNLINLYTPAAGK